MLKEYIESTNLYILQYVSLYTSPSIVEALKVRIHKSYFQKFIDLLETSLINAGIGDTTSWNSTHIEEYFNNIYLTFTAYDQSKE